MLRIIACPEPDARPPRVKPQPPLKRSGGLGRAGRLHLAPPALERQAPAGGGDQVADPTRPPGALRVRLDLLRVVEERLGDLPESLDSLGGGEQGVVAVHRV